LVKISYQYFEIFNGNNHSLISGKPTYCIDGLYGGNTLKIDHSTYEILQILSISLLDKTPINELLTSHNYQDVK